MADEVQGTVHGGNGEKLELRLGTKSALIAARDLIPILLVLSGLVGGYLIYVSVSERLAGLSAHQEQTLATLNANQLKMAETFHMIERTLQEHTNTFRQMLSTHEWNQSREPGERLPLDMWPELVAPGAHPGR
jgi:hypothetical protein